MVNCPSCGTSVEADFGMISCPKCSAVFMVDIDGSVQQPEAESEIVEEIPAAEADDLSLDVYGNPVASEPENVDAETYEAISEDPASYESATYEIPSVEAEPLTYEEPASEPTQEVVEEATEELVEQSADETTQTETEYSENFMDELNNPQEKPVEDVLGVGAFGESPAAQVPDGLYYYDLKISSLDSGQIRQSVVDALSDPRFGWLPEDLKKKISGGELMLPNLNPVKAVLAVIKLQSLDVEVEWSQKLYTDESVATDKEAP